MRESETQTTDARERNTYQFHMNFPNPHIRSFQAPEGPLLVAGYFTMA